MNFRELAGLTNTFGCCGSFVLYILSRGDHQDTAREVVL